MRPSRISVKAVLRTFLRLRDDVRGATAIEYGLIVSIIVVGIIAAIGGVGSVTSGIWNNTQTKIGAVSPR